jgi:hypothetical protein
MPNNTRLRRVSLKIPPNTLPVAKEKACRPTFFDRKASTIVRNWPKAAELRRDKTVSNLGYTGRAANVVGRTALDPKETRPVSLCSGAGRLAACHGGCLYCAPMRCPHTDIMIGANHRYSGLSSRDR